MFAEATASSVVNFLTDMPDLTQAAIEELPRPESPVMPVQVSRGINVPKKKSQDKENNTDNETVPTKRFKSTTEEEIENLYQSRQAPATKNNTRWAMKIFQG